MLAALRLGVLQLAFLDRVPAHAAVGESVELAKRESRRGAGLVNAVLRRAAREAPALVAALPDATPAEAALRHSHPEWIAELWFDALGPGEARALMAAGNEPAEAAVRINTLKAERARAARRRAARRAARGPRPRRSVRRVLVAAVGAGPVHAAVARRDGGRARPRPAARREVLDLCAAPGGKTTHLAALMGDEGRVVAVEKHPGRADALRRTAERMGATCVEVRTADAAGPHERAPTTACSSTRRARTSARSPPGPTCAGARTPRPRRRSRPCRPAILDAAAEALEPGGVLVYSTCTISPRENERLVGDFLERRDDFAVDELPSDLPVWDHPTVPGFLQTLPHRDGTDGFFIARLRRS